MNQCFVSWFAMPFGYEKKSLGEYSAGIPSCMGALADIIANGYRQMAEKTRRVRRSAPGARLCA